jgi:hypothetical protein
MKRASVASAELYPRYLPLQLRSTWCQKQALRPCVQEEQSPRRQCSEASKLLASLSDQQRS